MDEYYQRVAIDVPSNPIESPPPYDALLDNPSFRQRFNIQPREDEGREILPPYSTAISLQGVFLQKMELEGVVHRAQDRNWYRVLVTLQGTALSFYKCKIPGVFASRKSSPDFPAGTTKGAFLRSYNLQHADVGVAADYVKYVFIKAVPPRYNFSGCLIYFYIKSGDPVFSPFHNLHAHLEHNTNLPLGRNL